MPEASADLVSPERIEAAIAPGLEAKGILVEEVVVLGGAAPVVRVLIDRAEGTQGLDLDEVAQLSTAIDDALEAGPLARSGPYDLEVSTPGADRPFTRAQHWLRNVGRHVELRLSDGSELTGLLLEATDTAATIEPIKAAPKKGMKAKHFDPVTVEYAAVERAGVDLEATSAMLLAEASARAITNDETDEED